MRCVTLALDQTGSLRYSKSYRKYILKTSSRPRYWRTSDIWCHWTFLHKPLIKQMFQLVEFLFFKDCKQGTHTSIYCSVADELAGVSGLYYSDCKVKECNKIAKDPGLAKKLWQASERITGKIWKD